MVFNKDNLSQTDTTDAAFWSRVPIRSKFLPAADIEAQGEDIGSHTYLKDNSVSARFPGWLSAFADILREAYDPSGDNLDELPQSMLTWKADVMTSHNPVAGVARDRGHLYGRQ